MTLTDRKLISFTLNGEEVSVRGDHPHLLAALREELDIASAKDGCSPSGQCGCCTVLIGGKAIVSCVTSLEKAEGKEITTLEGFDPAERERLGNAFAACGALQCGFCTPGILVRTKALLDRKGSALTGRAAAGQLGAHLCRCTGYTKIFDAIDMLASGQIPPIELSTGIGKPGIKYEGRELALGDRGYVDDMRPDGMLHAALHLTEHSRADIVSIDTGAAKAMPGVVDVFRAADVPGELRVGIIYTDWPVFIPEGGRTSYYGDVLAIVVAEDRITARAAAGTHRGRVQRAHPRSPTRRWPSPPPRTPCGSSTETSCRRPSTPAAISRRPMRRRPTSCTSISPLSVSSMRSSSQSRHWPFPTRPATSWCTRVDRECGTTATRSPRC